MSRAATRELVTALEFWREEVTKRSEAHVKAATAQKRAWSVLMRAADERDAAQAQAAKYEAALIALGADVPEPASSPQDRAENGD